MIREYDITYITKEFLLKNNWKIIAYNPPGSQGTFTIPNPNKDSKYRGQTGSSSPDIIAYKKINERNKFLIIESKPIYNEKDVKKMIELFSDPKRLEIFFKIIRGYAIANDIDYDEKYKNVIYFVKAHGGNKNLLSNVSTIHIKKIKKSWNPNLINPKLDILKNFSVKFIKSSS